MHDPTTVVKAGQWIWVCNGAYKGNVGFVMEVETWGARVFGRSLPQETNSVTGGCLTETKANSHQA